MAVYLAKCHICHELAALEGIAAEVIPTLLAGNGIRLREALMKCNPLS